MGEEHIIIGRIARAWGIRGELLMMPETDRPERFEGLKLVWIGDEPEPRRLERVQAHGNAFRVKLADVNTRSEAELLQGEWVTVPMSQAIPLDEGQFFIHEIIGLAVWTEEGEFLGEVTDVLVGASNDVWVVEQDETEWLIPTLDDVVLAVDLEAGRVEVRLPPGLEPTPRRSARRSHRR